MEDEDLQDALEDAPKLSASEDESEAPVDDLEDEEAAEGEQDNDEGSEDGDDDEREFDEVEYAGKRYAIPKELKAGFMKDADYTRKTQEVAATRRDLDEQRQSFEQHAQLRAQTIQEQAQITAIDGELAKYQNAPWSEWHQQDPDATQSHRLHYESLKERRQTILDQVSEKEQKLAHTAQQETAKRVAETQDVLQRDIKGWGPDLAKKLTTFGLEQGFTQQQLTSLNTDSRAIKVLHKAQQYDELMAKRNQKGKRKTPIKPLETVSRKRSRPPASAAPSDRDDEATWMNKRNAQLRKRNQA
ncbi:MAG: hypothetical protein GY788_27645 [bacterium]|nr:hypothetical protein [bacterium]